MPELAAHLHRVLDGLQLGRSTKRIAADTGLSPNTVRTYTAHIFAAFDVHSRAELVVELASREPPPPRAGDRTRRRLPA